MPTVTTKLPTLSYAEMTILEKDWLMTVVSDLDEHNFEYSFARTDKSDTDHVKIVAQSNCSAAAWYKLSEHVKSLNVAAA